MTNSNKIKIVNTILIDFLKQEIGKTIPADCEGTAENMIEYLESEMFDADFEETITNNGAEAVIYDGNMCVIMPEGMTAEQRANVIEACKEREDATGYKVDLYGATKEEKETIQMHGLSEEEQEWVRQWSDNLRMSVRSGSNE